MFTRLSRPLLATTLILAAEGASAQENVMVVFDGSNSMWGQIEGVAKIEIARGVMDNLLGDWVNDRQVGLMAYGHRTRGDCSDIEMLVEPGAESRATILERIGGITPTGKTPLTDAVEQAATALSYTDQPATVVLISDGLESCERDPCALAQALEQGGVAFTAHVVGFGLGNDEDASSLACIAENTGGQYISASNATELGNALTTVGIAVAEADPEPQPEPEPEAPAVLVDAPDSAVGGSDVTITWAPTLAEADYINVVPVGTDSEKFGQYQRIGTSDAVTIAVPGQVGLYEARYLQNATKEVLGADVIEVTKPEVTLNAADTVETGASVTIGWKPTINTRDYINIVPAGTEETAFGAYQTVRTDTEVTLTAPSEPGLYEIRYVLNVDRSTVATRMIEVTNPSVVLQVPNTAQTGADFDVSWSRAVNARDYINIVPMGTEEGTFGNYITVRDDNKGVLKAPAEPGLYEVRYVLREGSKTLAVAQIEVTEPTVTVSGPDSVSIGADFDVSWTGTVDERDYVTIVPVGTEEGKFGNYIVVRDKTTGTLLAPAEPGLYELRYLLREGNKTLATTAIEVTEPQVTISAPTTALAGSKFDVSWTGTVNTKDYINIVPAGTEEGTYGSYIVVRDKPEGTLQAPAEPGLYEIRYVLREGAKTLATVPLEITLPEVTLTAPEKALAGSQFKVGWTGTVSTNDYINIVPMGTEEGKYGNYFVVRDKTSGALQAPSETGLYEIRYLLREGNKTMARATVEIVEPEVTISAVDAVRAGDKLSVTWTGTVSPNDYVTLVPLGAADNEYGEYGAVRDNGKRDFTAPDQIGLYEVRYVLREGGRVLARQSLEVLEKDAALNTGAAITAPESAAPGATIEIGWSVESDSADQRITIARGDQAIFTWISAEKITGAPPMSVTLPEAPGVYEIRFLDVANQEVLSRHVIKVE